MTNKVIGYRGKLDEYKESFNRTYNRQSSYM